MDVANASMYDGATATAEAVMMANRVTRRSKAILSGGLHPHYREVIATHAHFAGFTVERRARPIREGTRGPDRRDRRQDLLRRGAESRASSAMCATIRALAEACHKAGALLIVAVTEIVSLGARRRRRARMGADIVDRRGPVDRQFARLRRALCRAVRHAREISCGRCRAAWSARPSTPTAGAAGC